MPNQTDPNQTINPVTDIPPLPDYMNVPPSQTPQAAPPTDNTSGSAAPSDLPPVVATPKKKFGGGKIIATILGLFLLVGGVGAGVVLTQQQQIFNQKAAPVPECSGCSCGCNYDTSGNFSGCKDCKAAAKSNENSTATTNNNAAEAAAKQAATTTANNAAEAAAKQAATTTVSCTVGLSEACKTSGTPCCKTGLSCDPSTLICMATANGAAQANSGGAVCSQISCTATGCSVGSASTNCWVSHYWCQDVKTGNIGCGTDTGGQVLSTGSSASFTQNCGTEQIDIYCPYMADGTGCGYPHSTLTSGVDYISKKYSSACGGSPGAPMCTSVTAYDPSWVSLGTPQLSALAAGAKVNFCVTGSAPSGTFDKAQFTINGVQQAETTTQRPGSTDFCQNYTIQATDTTITVTAKIHHSTLGWY